MPATASCTGKPASAARVSTNDRGGARRDTSSMLADSRLSTGNRTTLDPSAPCFLIVTPPAPAGNRTPRADHRAMTTATSGARSEVDARPSAVIHSSNSHFDFRRFEGLGVKLHQEGGWTITAGVVVAWRRRA